MPKSSCMLDYLKEKGFKFYSGVPCSILKTMLKEVAADKEIKYISAVRENTALGVASGAYLSGEKSCILIQNSGLGNIINALTSFNLIYKIPVLMFITWRGFEGQDAPEHIIMGKKMTRLLEDIGIPYAVLGEDYKKDIDWALGQMSEARIPTALILKEGSIE